MTATWRRHDHEPELVYRASGNRVHYLATGAQTGGKFGLYRWEMAAGRGGPDQYFEQLPGIGDWSEAERGAFFVRHDTFWV